MSSTLTAGRKDGKQWEKIERNTRKGELIKILLRQMMLIVLMFARGLSDAQLKVATFCSSPRSYA
jgi:hypothetical protein